MKKQAGRPPLRNKVDQLTLQFLATSRDNMELTKWSLRERNKYREQIAHLFHQLHYDDDNTNHLISQIRTEYKNFIRACLHHLKMHERQCHLLANSGKEEEHDEELVDELELAEEDDDDLVETADDLVGEEEDTEYGKAAADELDLDRVLSPDNFQKAAVENDPFCLENTWPTFAGDDFGEDEFQRLLREAEETTPAPAKQSATPLVRTICFDLPSNTPDGCRRRK